MHEKDQDGKGYGSEKEENQRACGKNVRILLDLTKTILIWEFIYLYVYPPF